VCVCVCVRKVADIHTCRVSVCVCVFICMYVYVCMYLCIFMYIQHLPHVIRKFEMIGARRKQAINTFTFLSRATVGRYIICKCIIYIYVYIYIHTYIYVCTYVCVCIYIYICTSIHTYIHTYMRDRDKEVSPLIGISQQSLSYITLYVNV
jgi:hypothetical protein